MDKVRAFNDWLAIRITNFIGSMWCAYLFAAIAIYGLPEALKTLGIVNWFVEEFIQLVLLSVIMVGQNIQARKTSAIHEDIKEHHRLLKEIHERHAQAGDK